MTYSILFNAKDSITLTTEPGYWNRIEYFAKYGYTDIHYDHGKILLQKPAVTQIIEKSDNGKERCIDPTSFLQNRLQKVTITRDDYMGLVDCLNNGKIKFEDIIKFN